MSQYPTVTAEAANELARLAASASTTMEEVAEQAAAATPVTFDPNEWHHSQMTTLEAIELSKSGGHPYSSPNVPNGFDTVLGFFFDCYDWYPAMYEDENGNAMKDRELAQYEEWCAKYAARLGLEVKDVEPPEALKVHGIMTLKAYPETLIEIRCIEMP